MRWGAVGALLLVLLSPTLVHDVKVSNLFSTHIERIEGFRARLYQDTGGVWTIGFGHVPEPGEDFFGKIITREEGEALLKKDVREAEEAVNKHVKVLLRQEQFDALVSFVFNVGEEQFRRSTLLRKLNDGHCCAVPDELRRWNRDNGRVIPGLAKRREHEIALYTGAG